MTQEEKELLLKDLGARLPYGVKMNTPRGIYTVDAVSNEGLFSIPNNNRTLDDLTPHDGHYWIPITDDYKPYLRPLSSMTEEERDEYTDIKKGECNGCVLTGKGDPDTEFLLVDWLNEHHFDYRGLISMGLALEAPKNMYKIWQQ